MGCHSLLHGIFPAQGLKPGLLHCRQVPYHLTHQGSPADIKVDPSVQPSAAFMKLHALSCLLLPHSKATLIDFYLFLAASSLGSDTWDLRFVLQDLWLWCTDTSCSVLALSLHGEQHGMWDLSSPTGDLIYIPCIAWQTLNRWTTFVNL